MEALDPNIDRGADTLVAQCLQARAGETVQLLTWHADDVADAVERAAARARAVLRRAALEPFGAEGRAALGATLGGMLGGATASVLLAGTGVPTTLSIAVIDAARRAGTRHVHIVGVDRRLMAQSIRADPALLATINDRLAELLRAPARVRVSGEGGTALEVTLAPQYPLIRASGRPVQGESDNLPSGFVYAHPAGVQGVFVADRAVIGSGIPHAEGATRRRPVTFTIANGRVTEVQCADAGLRDSVQRYLASHADAARVGIALWPTNYLVRSEIGLPVQDELAPGMNLGLGFSEATVTRAPYDAPVQLRLLARRLDVEVRGQRLVRAGRFDDALVAGIDPFR